MFYIVIIFSICLTIYGVNGMAYNLTVLALPQQSGKVDFFKRLSLFIPLYVSLLYVAYLAYSLSNRVDLCGYEAVTYAIATKQCVSCTDYWLRIYQSLLGSMSSGFMSLLSIFAIFWVARRKRD